MDEQDKQDSLTKKNPANPVHPCKTSPHKHDGRRVTPAEVIAHDINGIALPAILA